MSFKIDATGEFWNITSLVIDGGLSIWFMPFSFTNPLGLMGWYTSPLADRQAVRINTDGTLSLEEANPLATNLCTTANSATLNVWNHAWVGNAGGVASVVLNGGTRATGTPTGVTGLNRTTIGRSHQGIGSYRHDGLIAEIAFWYDDLSAYSGDLVGSLAKGLSPLKVYPLFLTHYFPMINNINDYVAKVAFSATGPPTVEADHPRILMPRRNRIIVPNTLIWSESLEPQFQDSFAMERY